MTKKEWGATNDAWAVSAKKEEPTPNKLGALPVKWGTRYIRPPKCKDIPEHRLKFKFAQDAVREMDLQEGCRYFMLVDGTFIAGDLIEALIVEKELKVKTLTISTLSLSENNVDSLALLLDNDHVENLNLIISDYQFSHERHNLIPYIYQELDKNDRFQLAAAGTHCKIALIETENLKIVMHGSANLRSSSNIEQICIEESPELYDFNFECQSWILDKYQTIKKSVRQNILNF